MFEPIHVMHIMHYTVRHMGVTDGEAQSRKDDLAVLAVSKGMNSLAVLALHPGVGKE